jgi:hypothetical protein
MKNSTATERRILTTIPDAWLGGWLLGQRLRGNPDATIHDAVAYWQDQVVMAAEFERQRATSPVQS